MRMKKWEGIRNAGISAKLAGLFMLLLLVSWAVIFFIFYRTSYDSALNSAEALSAQTLSTVSKNVTTLIDNVAYYSRIILSNSDITDALAQKDEEQEKESVHQFTSLVDSETHINGIYLWDMDSNSCSIDKNHVRILRTSGIKETTWYQEVRELDGSYCVKLNADRVLTMSGADTSISLIRAVNNPVDLQLVGILMVNIDLDAFVECYSSMDDKSVSTIYILDDTGKIVSSRANITLPRFQEAMRQGREEGDAAEHGLVARLGQETYLLQETEITGLGWKILTGVPVGGIFTSSGTGVMLFLLALMFFALFCGIGYMVMRRYVAAPLEAMAGSMNRMTGRKFEKMNDGRDSLDFAELRILKGTYNQMVDEIEILINRVYEEEKVKRRAELNALQEQMKPHFLYNTIDAMSYLALSGKHEEVYDALEAFGSYYRILLSKGREMISVREEMTMVKDYLELQKLRYGTGLRYVLEIEEKISRAFILKMVLQPLVENSVNHGIGPKETSGVVFVEGVEEDGYLKFTVEDDGVGMDEREIEGLNSDNLNSNEKSFGLRGTIERLRIFYESDIEYTIRSTRGRGTTILLRIPIRYEGDENHD